jgi:hypothetical protein
MLRRSTRRRRLHASQFRDCGLSRRPGHARGRPDYVNDSADPARGDRHRWFRRADHWRNEPDVRALRGTGRRRAAVAGRATRTGRRSRPLSRLSRCGSRATADRLHRGTRALARGRSRGARTSARDAGRRTLCAPRRRCRHAWWTTGISVRAQSAGWTARDERWGRGGSARRWHPVFPGSSPNG